LIHEQKKVPIAYTSTETKNKFQTKRGSKPIIGSYKQRFNVT